MSRNLTIKQEKFCEHYVLSKDGSAAYRVAYDAEGMKKNTVRVNAWKLLKNEAITKRLDQLTARVANVAEQQFDVTAAKIVQELAKIGFANIQDYVKVGDDGIPLPAFATVTREQFAAIGEITFEDIETGNRTGKRVKFRLLDKRQALVDLGKNIGMFKETVKYELEWLDSAQADLDRKIAGLVACDPEDSVPSVTH